MNLEGFTIILTSKFKRKIKKFPMFLVDKFVKVRYLLSKDPFDKRLKTHKLSGKLKNRYACSLDYKTRIIFEIHDKIITILDIGSHDLYK